MAESWLTTAKCQLKEAKHTFLFGFPRTILASATDYTANPPTSTNPKSFVSHPLLTFFLHQHTDSQ
jgi:hypothetical protein